MNSTFSWLFLTLLCIAVQGFFSMMELAAVSFNRVRFEYYLSKKIKQATWLKYLMETPSRLFGTVMLGVNIALQVGSQAAREFYGSLGLNPDWAPLSQVFLVVIFGELAPLFAARRFPEHVIMLGIGVVYATSRIFAPVIWLISKIMHVVFRLFGQKGESFDLLISREELQKVLEIHEEENEFNIVVQGIFALKNTPASQIMSPLTQIDMISASSTAAVLRKKISGSEQRFVPLYHKNRSHIVAIANARDLVRLADNQYIREHARPPWFITAETPLMPILSQFRYNQQSLAVVLDKSGSAVGVLTLDSILKEIFGEYSLDERRAANKNPLVIHRTFPGNTKISDFNAEYHAALDPHGVETLAQLVITLLDHPPGPGDAVVVGNLELIVEEASILGVKSLTVKSLDD